MDEDSLKEIHISELFDMMVKRTDEITKMDKKEDETNYKTKKKEIELLQRTIIARRLGFLPVNIFIPLKS